MSPWNHAICEACWIRREGVWEAAPEFGDGAEKLTGVRLPHRLRIGTGDHAAFIGYPDVGIEQCCFCGQPSISGIVIRLDPNSADLFARGHPHAEDTDVA
jgi:hypothetical protein